MSPVHQITLTGDGMFFVGKRRWLQPRRWWLPYHVRLTAAWKALQGKHPVIDFNHAQIVVDGPIVIRNMDGGTIQHCGHFYSASTHGVASREVISMFN